MHPPAGGSRAFKGSFALSLSELSRLLLVLPRRFTRTTATGVMLSNHKPLLRQTVALPAFFLFLFLLTSTSCVSSSPTSCITGQTYWDSIRESCVPCTRCVNPEAPIVLIPCQPHRDVRCGSFSALGIDWSWMRTSHVKQQKRLQAQIQRSSVSPTLHPVTSPPPSRSGLIRKVQRPRTPEDGDRVPKTAARVMESTHPPRLPVEGVVLPSVREEEAAWTWQHWLVFGVAMVVMCGSVLVLAPLAMRRMRGSETCRFLFRKKSRPPERKKRQIYKGGKTEHGSGKGGKGALTNGAHGFYSANQNILLMEELLDRKKAAAWSSLREESANLYVEDKSVKVVAPTPSFTVVSMAPGMVPSVKVEVQGVSGHKNMASNCRRLGCASRTVLTGRSSAV